MDIEEIIIKLVNNGMDIELISKMINVDIEEIKKLATPNN